MSTEEQTYEVCRQLMACITIVVCLLIMSSCEQHRHQANRDAVKTSHNVILELLPVEK